MGPLFKQVAYTSYEKSVSDDDLLLIFIQFSMVPMEINQRGWNTFSLPKVFKYFSLYEENLNDLKASKRLQSETTTTTIAMQFAQCILCCPSEWQRYSELETANWIKVCAILKSSKLRDSSKLNLKNHPLRPLRVLFIFCRWMHLYCG